VKCQEILQDAFRTDVRPLVVESRLMKGAAIDPIRFFRDHRVREKLVGERGSKTLATGL
jgi:L-rhamnose isomerase/sugar isomerase